MTSFQQPEISSIPSNPDGVSLPNDAIATNLVFTLQSGSEKDQRQLIEDLQQKGEAGWAVLMEFLRQRQAANTAPSPAGVVPDLAAGAAYQALLKANSDQVKQFLQTHVPQGIVPLESVAGIDYAPLQQCLAEQEFQRADQLTLQKMCELAGPAAVKRKWLYFTEVEQFPIADLQLINALWLVHSGGQFGFSVQREIWLSLGKNWDKFWPKIAWKSENTWTRYPQEFTWNLTAPRGHLPLSNQLRGVRVMASLLGHPAWTQL